MEEVGINDEDVGGTADASRSAPQHEKRMKRDDEKERG